MSVTLKAELDIAAALAPLASLGKDAMRNAWRRALKKSANWVKGQTAKHVSAEMHIAQKLIRQRLYFFLRSADKGKVWLGLNAVEAHRLGNPRQTRRGVSVGRHRFDNAWIYRSKRGSKNDGKVFRRVGKARMPITAVKLDWADKGEAAFRKAAAEIEARLMVILEQEVKYEILKATRNAR